MNITRTFLGLSAGFLITVAAVAPATADLVVGTPKSERLDGTVYTDTIRGRGGANRIHASAGSDRVFGDRGRDTLWGQSGGDLLSDGYHQASVPEDSWTTADVFYGGVVLTSVSRVRVRDPVAVSIDLLRFADPAVDLVAQAQHDGSQHRCYQ
jgi:Ca2+-binding RTX toxin-like protein